MKTANTEKINLATPRGAHQNRCSLNEIWVARGDWPVAVADLCGVERLFRFAEGGMGHVRGDLPIAGRLFCHARGGLAGAGGDRWLLRGVLCLIGLDLFCRLTSMSRRSPSILNRLGRMSNRSTIMSSGSAPMTNRLSRMSKRLAGRTGRPPSTSGRSPRRMGRMAGRTNRPCRGSQPPENVLNEINTPAKTALLR